MLESFTAQTFTPLLGSAFRVVDDSGPPVPLELINVSEWGSPGSGGAPAGPRRTPFTLLFRGPRDGYLPQRIYPLEHATLGTFDLFIVPIGPDAQGMRYEAIFT